jgi:hypothetical protein
MLPHVLQYCKKKAADEAYRSTHSRAGYIE